MKKMIWTIGLAVLPALALAGDSANTDEAATPLTFTMSMTGGFSSTFELPLGGSFGKGPDVTDSLTASLGNAFRQGDSLSVFGWNTTDLPSSTPDWEGGMIYETRLFRRGRHSLTINAGVQRWLLPNVGSGAKDWLISDNLTYATRVKKIPVYVSESSWSMLKSTLPAGSAIYTQVFTEHSLVRRHDFELLLREGPSESYSWGFYGLNGNCAFHYSGSLEAVWKGTKLNAEYHQQFGLQDAVPNSHYWEFSLTRQLVKVERAN